MKSTKVKYSTKDSFIAQFGAEEAERIMCAAEMHMNGIHDEAGTDVFRWAILICIGYECMEIEHYRNYHNITTPWQELKEWIKTYANITSHDGDVDYLAFAAGAYDEFLTES